MKVFNRFVNKKRAVSPVIAVILLIGLAVASVAVIFVVVLPLLQPTTNLQMDDAYIEYDGPTTIVTGVGKGRGTLILSNAGTGNIDIVSLRVYYASSIVEPLWIEIENHTKTGITKANPYELQSLDVLKVITVGFPIPEENDNNTISYRITITTSEGAEFDTSTETNVDATDMLLSKDRPDISFLGTSLGNLRRTESEKIRPSDIDDNSEIKNVIYRVYSDDGDLVLEETIPPTSSLWTWVWDTRNDSADGLNNGSYYMTMTVSDYAGLSNKTDKIYFTIDNDYTPPTINYIAPEANWAEVGESYTIVANVVDTGCDDSQVKEVWLYYKLLNETSYAAPIRMGPLQGNNYSDSIPIDARALVVDLTYYINAIDLDDNNKSDYTPILEANDTKFPNIFHDPIIEAVENNEVSIHTLVEDPGMVNTSEVFLFVRKSNDLEANATVEGVPLPSSWISLYPTLIDVIDDTEWNFTWEIPQAFKNVTIHGLDYYITATDKYGGNTAQHGPHHIDIPDLNSPNIETISYASEWTENTVFPITLGITDNDPTFGRIVNGDLTTYATGGITIFYKNWDGNPGQLFDTNNDYNTTVHILGNSSNNEMTSWFGIIPSSIFVSDSTPRLDFYVEVTDQSSQTTRMPATDFYSVTVNKAGEPDLDVQGSVSLINNNATVSFKIVNKANQSGATEANAYLTGMYLQIFSEDVDFTNGRPNLTKVVFSDHTTGDTYNGTTGSPHPWGGNGSRIWFDEYVFIPDDGGTNTIDLTFTNTSGSSIDMHNMELYINFTAKVGPLPSSDNTTEQSLGLVSTPTLVYVPTSVTQYMRSDFHTINGLNTHQLGITQTTSSVNDLQEASGDVTVTWGIRVFVRSAAGAETEITPGSMVGTVQRSTSGSGLQSASWNCPQTTLSSTDAIVIRVYVQIGTSSPVIQAEFITEQLDSIELKASTWTIYYWTDRTRAGPVWNRRTQATLVWGDSSYPTRIENFQFVQPG